MATHILSIARPRLDRRGLIAVGSAVALSAFIFVGRQGAPDYADLAANREVEMHVARLPIQSLDELTQHSSAAVVGRVVAKGTTRFIPMSGGAPRAFEAGPDGLEMIAFGVQHPGDGEPVDDDWVK